MSEPALTLQYYVAPRGYQLYEAVAFRVSGQALEARDGSGWRQVLRWNPDNQWWLDPEGQIARELELARVEVDQSEIAIAVAGRGRTLSGFLHLHFERGSFELTRYDPEARERQLLAKGDGDGWHGLAPLGEGAGADGELLLALPPAATAYQTRIEPTVRVRPSELSA